MADFSQLRTTMVDTQIRPSDVTKYPIISAMLATARENFVPEARRETAYVGGDIPLGGARVILDPRVFAKMIDALDIQNDELVLDVGAGLGYSSAVISRMAQAVVALEEDATLAADGAAALTEAGCDNVIPETGALAAGAPQHGPYDAIIVEGGVERLPEALTDQLKDGGKICAIFLEGALGIVKLGYKIDGVISWRMSFNATAPVLSGFEAEKAFSL